MVGPFRNGFTDQEGVTSSVGDLRDFGGLEDVVAAEDDSVSAIQAVAAEPSGPRSVGAPRGCRCPIEVVVAPSPVGSSTSLVGSDSVNVATVEVGAAVQFSFVGS